MALGVDLWGRLSNPPEAIETVAAQGFTANHEDTESIQTKLRTAAESTHRLPPEEKGRLSNPIQRRLCPTEINDLIAAYRAGATIGELADRYGLHRTTVTAHLDRHHIERHHSHTEWTSESLATAADLYATGLSLAAIGARFGIDPQTVANRFRRAGIPIRTRPGWPPQHKRN